MKNRLSFVSTAFATLAIAACGAGAVPTQQPSQAAATPIAAATATPDIRPPTPGPTPYVAPTPVPTPAAQGYTMTEAAAVIAAKDCELMVSELSDPDRIKAITDPDVLTAIAEALAHCTATGVWTESEPAAGSYDKLSSRGWAKIVKAPDNYTGKGYQVWACITQFDAATGADAFRGQASFKKEPYWYSDGDNTYFRGDADQLADFVADDMVVMNVTSLGSYSYDTQSGGNTTVPLFQVEKITRKGSCA